MDMKKEEIEILEGGSCRVISEQKEESLKEKEKAKNLRNSYNSLAGDMMPEENKKVFKILESFQYKNINESKVNKETNILIVVKEVDNFISFNSKNNLFYDRFKTKIKLAENRSMQDYINLNLNMYKSNMQTFIRCIKCSLSLVTDWFNDKGREYPQIEELKAKIEELKAEEKMLVKQIKKERLDTNQYYEEDEKEESFDRERTFVFLLKSKKKHLYRLIKENIKKNLGEEYKEEECLLLKMLDKKETIKARSSLDNHKEWHYKLTKILKSKKYSEFEDYEQLTEKLDELSKAIKSNLIG